MTLRDKIINGEKLTSREVADIVYEDADLDYEIIEEISDGHGRWMEYMTSIIKLDKDDFYALSWERGLTEYQDNQFDSQVATPMTRVPLFTYEWVAKE